MGKISITRGHGLLEVFLAKKRAGMVNKLIPDKLRGGRILDVGCGSFPFFLVNTEFGKKYGLDPSVKAEVNGIMLKSFDVEKNSNLPFRDGFFDVVTMLAVFEHLEPRKIPGILDEIRRVLKPGGRFILTTPCPWADRILRFMAWLGLVSSREMKEHKGAYCSGDIKRYLSAAGFEPEKMKFGYFEVFMNNWALARK